MKGMPTLFEMNIAKTDEDKASEFVSKLQSKGFVGVNKIYLQNYINADISIAFSHIKTNYIRYVCKGKWSEDKFRDIIYVIAGNRQMLIPNVFLRYGIQYDDGDLAREISVEQRKYEHNKSDVSISEEEDELLRYIAENGGM